MGERIGWIDAARAIGIVAVVIGHTTQDRTVWSAVFHFHMPLFFMLSGLVFTPGPVWDVAERRARSLLLPYVAWLVIVAVLDLAIARAAGHAAFLPWDRPVAAVARAVLGGTFLVGAFGTFWFVTCLYLVQLAGAAILRLPDRLSYGIAAALFLSIYLVRHWPSPWGVISVPAGLFFFLAGAFYRRHPIAGSRAALAAAAVAATFAAWSRPLDLKIADVGTPVISVVAALGLCHLVFVIARRLPPSRVATSLGQASLMIMYLHLTIVHALRGAVPDVLLVAFGVTGPVLLWLLIRQFDMLRIVLLGERAGDRFIGRSSSAPGAPLDHQHP